MHSRSPRAARSEALVALLGAVMIAGTTLSLPAVAATANLSSTWSPNLGSGNSVTTAAIIALGAGGGACSSTVGGRGAQVVGAITLATTDTVIGYPGGLGSACGTPTGGAGGVGTDPITDYRGGNGGLGFNGDNIAESGAGGGAATTVYKNATTQVAFAGGGGGAGGDAVALDNTQVQGGVPGAGSGGVGGNGAAGGTGAKYPVAATGGNGGAGGFAPWSRGKDASNATCSSGACGGPAGGGAGTFNSTAAGDGAATSTQAAGGGGGGGGASAGPGLAGPLYSVASSVAGGSASVTYIVITAGSVDNAVVGGTYAGTPFTADGGWTGLTWALDAACPGCSLPGGLTLDSSTGAISGSVTAVPGSYTFGVVATGNPGSAPLSSFSLRTRRSITLSVAAAPLQASLAAAFGLTTIAPGGNTTLTFTITNPPANNPLQTFSFADTLPAGLRIAAAPNVGGTCTGGSVIAAGGTGNITVTDRTVPASAAASTTCTITVDVTNASGQLNPSCASTPAAFTNASTNINGLVNLTNSVVPSCVVVAAVVPGSVANVPTVNQYVLIALMLLLAGGGAFHLRKAAERQGGSRSWTTMK